MDLHQIWPHRWISAKAKSFKSNIAGIGVVAVDEISKGETILVYGGIIVPKSDILKYQRRLGHVGIQANDDFFLVPTDREELRLTGIINHSCNPNSAFKDTITIVAIRNIKKGEEVTFDYAFSESYLESFKCRCGSKNCRKIITQDDWKIKELQEKYGQYFSPYLKGKISKS